MKKSRTSTKSKGNLAAEVARVEETLQWGLVDQGTEVETGVVETEVEPEIRGALELRHPQL